VTVDSQENPLNKHVFAVATVAIGACCTFLVAAVQVRNAAGASTGSGPATTATAPATLPALEPAEIKVREAAARAVLNDFFKAMFGGDDKAAYALLDYTDVDESGKPKSQEKAQSMLGEVAAEQRLRKAVTAAFGDVPFKLGRGDADVAAFNKDFETARATVAPDGTRVTVSMPLGISYVLIWKNGKYLVDFDKTQAGIGPLPRVEDLAALAKMTEGYGQLAKDVAAKKFGTVDEVTKEADKIAAAAAVKQADTLPAATALAPATTRP
jgi:hypothetical protein